MVKAVVEGTQESGFIEATGAVDPVLLEALLTEMAPLRQGSINSRIEVLQELAGIKSSIRIWHKKPVDKVIQEASAYSARLTEIWTELRLLESEDRQYTQLRTMQVSPVIDEIDRQYKFAQSRIAVMRQDIDLSR